MPSLIAIISVASYAALAHVPPRLTIGLIYFFSVRLTLELHKVWHRLCAVASPNIGLFVFCDRSCSSPVAAKRTLFSVVYYFTSFCVWQKVSCIFVYTPSSFYRTQVGFRFSAVCDFLFVPQICRGTAERICAKFTEKTCLVPHSDEFQCQGQRSKVKVTRDKKRAVHSHHSPAATEWNTLAANDVTQQKTGQFRRCRGWFWGLRAVCVW